MNTRILVTAFEPWGTHRVNTSQIAVEGMDGQFVADGVHLLERLPASRRGGRGGRGVIIPAPALAAIGRDSWRPGRRRPGRRARAADRRG